jgi:hypothetical protein
VTINESCTVKGTLAAQAVDISGTHSAVPAGQTGVLIARDNHEEAVGATTSAGVNEQKLVKTLRIAGKGSCTIRAKWQGTLLIQTHKEDGTWDYFPPPGDRLRQTYSEGDITVTLYNDVNVIRLWGQASGSGSNGTSFRNEKFEARSKDDPGLFRFMSGPV